ncbi:selenide, water dikinase SelD [Actinomadura atramentaria]|uniref:selenide, water dikinase SelD n=1 Tax=Actinomadura atramentaria TaxID=1990 RepID=UPI00036C4DFC|nr:selenide, water dikinase SelD [Actinomadura atramentaria]
MIATPRLTRYARAAGGAGKLPPAELERLVDGLVGPPGAALLTGGRDGADAAVLRLDPAAGGRAVVSAAGFSAPVVDDPYDWGRIAAADALSHVYAVGGTPLMALNLLGWPRDALGTDVAREVLRGGRDAAAAAGCLIAGGHSVDDREPSYGLAVTGTADPDRMLRPDAGAPGLPLTLTKPLGLGVLGARHRATGEVFPAAVAAMTRLNAAASGLALARGHTCATAVGGTGLLGQLLRIARASGVTAVVDAAAVPYLEGARGSARDGFVPSGTHHNLAWVADRTDFGRIAEEERLLLADAQTSGGLVVAGEIPGAPVIGELVPPGDTALVVR